jgi:hypothetical protein
MVLARSCALTAVSAFLAEGVQQKENTVRQRLRAWCYEAEAKRGIKRQEIRVEPCFAPWLGWVLSWWQGTQLAIALDATSLGDKFVVLAISVLYRGCAIPVAWVVLEAGKKHAWRREWLRMLRRLKPRVPKGWTVLVLADRGLYARWLFRRIVRLGWHPFLRINNGGTFRPEGSPLYRRLVSFVPEVGTAWSGRGTAFQGRGRQLECTLLARWEAGDNDPWLILTDLPAEASEASWYGLLAWIEQGFKITKRAGLAVAAYADERSQACRASVAGGVGGDLVAVERRWGRGGSCGRGHAVGGNGAVPAEASWSSRDLLASGECVSSGVDRADRGLDAPGAAASGSLGAGAVAQSARSRRGERHRGGRGTCRSRILVAFGILDF